MLKRIKRALTFIFILLAAGFFFPQGKSEVEIQYIKSEYLPLIENLDPKDLLFSQYSLDLMQFYKDFAKGNPFTNNFYAYKPKKNESLFWIAARCNIPVDTIASLNNIANADYVLEGKTLLLPTASGLFIADTGKIRIEKPLNSLEALIQKNCIDKLDYNEFFCYNINERYYLHLPGEKLDPTTRAFFLDVKMRTPLDHYWLSSDYGYRPSPFNGEKQFHRGIDMAAPEGTPVFACKEGRVISIVRMDPTFGNYIVIKHPSGLSSIYAHLSKIKVSKNGEKVATGQEIGLVGKTGRVTGPHLHFEIRQNGQATNPNAYIRH